MSQNYGYIDVEVVDDVDRISSTTQLLPTPNFIEDDLAETSFIPQQTRRSRSPRKISATDPEADIFIKDGRPLLNKSTTILQTPTKVANKWFGDADDDDDDHEPPKLRRKKKLVKETNDIGGENIKTEVYKKPKNNSWSEELQSMTEDLQNIPKSPARRMRVKSDRKGRSPLKSDWRERERETNSSEGSDEGRRRNRTVSSKSGTSRRRRQTSNSSDGKTPYRASITTFFHAHESRHSLMHDSTRKASMHTKAIYAHGTNDLKRWRSLEDVDLQNLRSGGYDFAVGKRSIAHMAATHGRGYVSSHSESDSESDGSMSSSEEEDELLEAEIEMDMINHGYKVSKEIRGRARQMHIDHHEARAKHLAIKDIAKINTRHVLHDIRNGIREILLLADGADFVKDSKGEASSPKHTIGNHIRITAHRLMEDFVSLKPHLHQSHEKSTSYNMKMFDLRQAMGGNIRSRRKVTESKDDDVAMLELGVEKKKKPQSKLNKIWNAWPWMLQLYMIFIIGLMLIAGHLQPHGDIDPLRHAYSTAPGSSSYHLLNPEKPMTYVEVSIKHSPAEDGHGTTTSNTTLGAVTLWFERKVGDEWERIGDRNETCKQSRSLARHCVFEGWNFDDENNSEIRCKFQSLLAPDALALQPYTNGNHLSTNTTYLNTTNTNTNNTDTHDTTTNDHDVVHPIIFEMSVHQMDWIGEAKVPIAFVVLIGVLITIATEVIDRTLVALAGSLLTVGLLLKCELMPPFQDAVIWLDEGTLALLFGMMYIIGKTSETGMFAVATKYIVRWSGDSLFKLTAVLCLFTALLSAFLDNVTTIMLLAPVTIELSHALQLPSPIPLLIAETLFSNIGGTATLIGDPPNIIVGSALSEHIGFVDFLANMLPGVMIIILPCLALLKWQFGEGLSGKLLHHNEAVLLCNKHTITNVPLMKQCMVCLGGVIVCFITHSIHEVNPAWIALLGAIGLMCSADAHSIHHALLAIEWDTLLFFASLFVMVEGMAEVGMIRTIADGLVALIEMVDEGNRLNVAIILLVWVSAITSSFLDNIPYTTTMVPVIVQMADHVDGLGLPIATLAWALCFGACLGGNGTLIGASANIVCTNIAAKHGYKIGFMDFMKKSFPIMLLSTLIAMAYMVLRYGDL